MTPVIKLVLILLALLCANPAYAQDCTNPDRPDRTIIFNEDYNVYQFCRSGTWVSMLNCTIGGPNFTFTDLTNVATSTLFESEILQIQINAISSAAVTIAGDGSPQYRICDDGACSTVDVDWTNASELLESDQYLQVRLTSSATAGATNSATINVGGGIDSWNVSTTPPPASCPNIGDVCPDFTYFAGFSPDGNALMYVTSAASEAQLPWNNGNGSGNTTTSQTSATTGRTNTSNLTTIDSDSGVGGPQPHQAAQYCADLNAHGHTDWYLPAKDELNLLWNNGSPIAGVDATGWCYESSSELDNSHEWMQRFDDGNQSGALKNAGCKIRCVRNDDDPCAGSPSPGDVCADGSVYAGLSPDGNVKMYTTPADQGGIAWNNGNSSGYVTTSQTSTTTGEANTGNLITIDSDSGTGGTQPHQAAQACADLSAHDKTDWYLPAKDELNVLYTNKAAIGGFNTSGTFPAGYYWSSSEGTNDFAWGQRFSDANQNIHNKASGLSVRCVRR